ncbi:type III-A CRISPR-associated protein Csm2 [Parafilimonas terrae]|uniref:CRISPR system Cms protein Csm2 n=1 Tax=Parafilimonas terrae TaxID=1465490 RepID=A0A1I5TK12_9BACT|nr:type III-A CRISPR-associated protein Csm2 [Parafilimonas terrae]SFP83201.1 CRISPR type III-A/MTUBE-associated protein Csm2 [Parafilimonas terrae]
MSKDYNKNHNRNQKPNSSDSISKIADKYTPAIKNMLLFEESSTAEIKAGIESIKSLMEKNSGITAHQIRNIFSLIKDLKEKDAVKKLNELQLLRPKLAYIGARQKDDDGKIIITVLDDVIKSIDLSQDKEKISKKINGLHYIMESMVAYHKFYSKD